MFTYIIIEEDQLLREEIRTSFSKLMDFVCQGEAGSGADAIRLLKDSMPDFAVMDMKMNIVDGLLLHPYITETYPNIPMINIRGLKSAIAEHDMEKAVQRIRQETTQMKECSEDFQKEQQCYHEDLRLLRDLIQGHECCGITFYSKGLDFVQDFQGFVLFTLDLALEKPEETISQFLREHKLDSQSLYLPPIEEDSVSYLLLFLSNESDHLLKARQTTDTLMAWMKYRNTHILAGISKFHSDLRELPWAFLETADFLDRQTLISDPVYGEAVPADASPVSICWDGLDEFLFRLESGSLQEIFPLSEELFYYYTTLKGCRLLDVKHHALQVCGRCMELLEYYNLPEQPKGGLNTLRMDLKHIFSLGRLIKYLQQYFVQITTALMPLNEYKNGSLSDNLKTYIGRSRGKCLTPESLARIFELAPEQLQSQFEEMCGQKLLDYLNKARITHAKELLSSTDLKMLIVAQEAGFDNVKDMLFVFRKYETLTPEQYRKQVFEEDLQSL